KPELAPDEAAPGRRDCEEELGVARELVPGLEHSGLGAAEEVGGAEGVATVRERDDDAVPASQERAELVLGLGKPAGSDGRTLRLEGERLSGRERIELGRALEVERLAREL